MANETDPVGKLKSVLDEAYDYGMKNKSCSHTVHYAMKKLFDDKIGYRKANDWVDYFNNESQYWTTVNVVRAGELANKGKLVIAGKKEAGNGHVIIVYPGSSKPRGGYSGVRQGASYPLALSASMGSWAGAKSKGDKTVWDPWANDTKFKDVGFWAPIK